MVGLLDLDLDVLASVLIEWLPLVDLGSLDCAVTSCKRRAHYLSAASHGSLCVSVQKPWYDGKVLEWIKGRKFRCRVIDYHGELDFLDFQAVVSQSVPYLEHLDLGSKCFQRPEVASGLEALLNTCTRLKSFTLQSLGLPDGLFQQFTSQTLTSITITSGRASAHIISCIGKQCPNLESLSVTVDDMLDFDPETVGGDGFFGRLRTLVMPCGPVGLMAAILQYAKDLTSLSTQIQCHEALIHCQPNLQTLYYYCCDSSGLDYYLQQCNSLTDVELVIDIEDSTLLSIRCENLRRLCLDEIEVGVTVNALISVVHQLASIESLLLGVHCTNEALISAIAASCSKLRKFELSVHDLKDSTSLVRLVANNPHLRHFDANCITDEVLSALASHSVLEHLHTNLSASLTPAGVRVLIAGCPNLTYLVIPQVRVDDALLLDIVRLTRVAVLHVCATRLTPAGVLALVDQDQLEGFSLHGLPHSGDKAEVALREAVWELDCSINKRRRRFIKVTCY